MTLRMRRISARGVVALLALVGWLAARPCAADEKPGAAPGRSLQFQPVVLEDDPRAIGGPVARFLVPADWKTEGQMVWDLRRIFNPAGSTIRVTSPDGKQQIAIFPKLVFTWSTDPLTMTMFPQGSMYLGQDVQPVPRDAGAAIMQYVVPRFLSQSLNGARVVQTQELPKLADAVARLAADGPLQAKSVAARLRFEGGKIPAGSAVDVYAVTTVIPMPALQRSSWGIAQIIAIEGPARDLEELFHIYEAMAASTRLNLKWFNVYMQVCDGLKQIAKNASDAAVVRSQIIAHAQHEISDSIQKRFENQQAASDKIFQAWSETIRGVERWNSGGGQVELPNGYGYAWHSDDGRYFVTDDPFADPNKGSKTNWSQLNKAQ